MNKIYATCIVGFMTWCAAAQACSPRLDGKPTFCPEPGDIPFDPKPIVKPKPLIPKQEAKGEVDIYNPYHWHTLHGVFVENLRRKRIEENMTPPSDAINSALDDFMEAQYGSDGSTEQEKLL